MKSSTVLKELLALKEAYRKQNFTYTTDQQERYKELLAGIDGNIESLKSKAISGGC